MLSNQGTVGGASPLSKLCLHVEGNISFYSKVKRKKATMALTSNPFSGSQPTCPTCLKVYQGYVSCCLNEFKTKSTHVLVRVCCDFVSIVIYTSCVCNVLTNETGEFTGSWTARRCRLWSASSCPCLCLSCLCLSCAACLLPCCLTARRRATWAREAAQRSLQTHPRKIHECTIFCVRL